MECAHVLLESTNGRSAFDSSKSAAVDQLLRASALANTSEQALGLLHEANSICQDMSQNTFQNRQIASLLSQAIAMQTLQDLDVQDTVDKALKVTELDSRCAGAWLRAARWAAKLSQPVAGVYAKRAIESDDSMRFDALLKLRPSDRLEAEQLLASWPQK